MNTTTEPGAQPPAPTVATYVDVVVLFTRIAASATVGAVAQPAELATVGGPESVPGPVIATGHGSPAFAWLVSVTVYVQLYVFGVPLAVHVFSAPEPPTPAEGV